MSSRPTNSKRTALLVCVALGALALCGVALYLKGGFGAEPSSDLGALPTFNAASMTQEAVGGVDLLPPVDVAHVEAGAGLQPAPVPPAAPVPATLTVGGTNDAPTTIGATAPPSFSEMVDAPEAGISAELADLIDLKRRTDLGRSRVEAMRVDLELQTVEEQLHGAAIGANQLPELVGLSGTKDKIVAEFLIGNRLLHARRGDWVTREWKLSEVMSTGVTMQRRDGGETRTILFGDSPERAGRAL